MTASEIIKQLGGPKKVAGITGAKPNAVTQWYYAGIPGRYWPEIIAAADEAEIAGVTFDVLRGTKPARQCVAA